MLTIYKNKKDIPSDKEYVELNDLYFNMNTSSLLDDRAKSIIEAIDSSEQISKYKIRSRFNGDVLNIDKLSSGCKTVLNVLYNPEKVFCLKECGENALDVLFGFEKGAVYSDYPIIPFDFEKVAVFSDGENKVIDDYEELKEWWSNAD